MASKKSDNVFVKAKAYRKAHPRCSFQDAIKKVSGKKRKPAKKKAAPKKKVSGVRKKSAAPARKNKTKIKAGRKGSVTVKIGKVKKRSAPKKHSGGLLKSLGISGISINKVQTEIRHRSALEQARDKHKMLLKNKGLKPSEKSAIKRDIKKYGSMISEANTHIRELKKTI